MNILSQNKIFLKKFLVLSYAAFVIFTSVFMKYSVNVHAASVVGSLVGDYITNSVGDDNFARMVLYKDMAYGFSIQADAQDFQNFLDGYSSGIGGRFQKYCVDVLGFDDATVKKATPLIQGFFDNTVADKSLIFKGAMYGVNDLIDGFGRWDADTYEIHNNKDLSMADASDSEILNGLEPIINNYYDSFPIHLKEYGYYGNEFENDPTRCHCDLSNMKGYGKIVAIVFPPVSSDSKVINTYDGYKYTTYCYILTTDANGRIWRHDINFSYVKNNYPYVSKIDLSNDNTSNIYCSPTVAAANNITNFNNNVPLPQTTIKNIFNTENFHEGDTLHNTDNLYSDEFSLNYNRINDLYYIPIKVDTSKLTDEQKKNCPCDIVTLPQGDFLMLPITQDNYHMPDLFMLDQLVDNGYCTQQDFTNQFRSIMNYTLINKDGDVYNYNNETVSKETYNIEVNEYNKNNYIPNGTNITKIFPFCLPFDIYKLLTPFNVSPETPKFVVNFANFNSNIKFNDASSCSNDASSGSPEGGSMDIDFNILKIDEVAKLLRTGEIVLFTISLAIWFFKAVSK